METDELADKRSENMEAGWTGWLQKRIPEIPFRLAAQHRAGPAKPEKISKLLLGGFNHCYIITFDDGVKVVCRFPICGQTWFRNEQTDSTVNTIKYLRSRSAIPIPRVIGRGVCEAGPYTIYAYVDGVLLEHFLENPTAEALELRPGITNKELFQAYKPMANILLELYRESYPRGGAIGPRAGALEVCRRPLTFTVNELVRAGGVSEHLLPDKARSFATTAEFWMFLADLQFLNLKHQRNNAISSEWNCHEKYVARCLFRVLVNRLCRYDSSSSSLGTFKLARGPFKLHCDDFRPGNVFVRSKNDLSITGVIDWDFCYTAPPEFAEAAPAWLLLANPLDYEDNLDGFLDLYRAKLEVFLRAMRECEDKRLADGRMKGPRLSDRMEASMGNGVFWMCLAMRKHMLFDVIYWKFLDQKFFGEFTSLEDRVAKFLPREDREGMEEFVKMKVRQMKDPKKWIEPLLPKKELLAL